MDRFDKIIRKNWLTFPDESQRTSLLKACMKDACEQLLQDLEYTGWISIEDQLPPDQDIDEPCNKFVLVYGKFGMDVAIYMNGAFYKSYSAKYTDEAVTHWMPSPKKPSQ